MNVDELISMLTAGLNDTEAATVKNAILRDGVKNKVESSYKTAKEIEAIQTAANKVADMERQLDALDEKGNPVGYRSWYQKYGNAAVKYLNLVSEFEGKHGAGSFEKTLNGQPPETKVDTKTGITMTEDDIRRIQQDNWTKNQAPVVASAVTSVSKILQRHLRNKRENDVDFEALGKLANEKYGGNMEAAYDEYDKPEREKLAEVAAKKAETDREAEIQRRVKEEMQKLNAGQYFPTNFSAGPSVMTERTKSVKEGFDKPTLLQDLAKTFVEAGNERAA